MELTCYNSYDCSKDPRHLFSPKDLESMRQYDKVIESAYFYPPIITVQESIRALQLVLSGQTAKRAIRNIRRERMNRESSTPPEPVPDAKAKKREYNRRYAEKHHDEISARVRRYRKENPLPMTEERREYMRAYYMINKDTIVEHQRMRRAKKHEGGNP